MTWDDIYGSDPYGLDDWMVPTGEHSIPKNNRTVRKKGETIRQYKNRVLHIRYPVNEKKYAADVRRRKKLAAKNRSPRASYVSSSGLTYSQRRTAEKGTRAIHEREIKNDVYELGDMRALLKDAHWEEVCGHKRWMFDNKTLIKEFKRYQQEYQRMY